MGFEAARLALRSRRVRSPSALWFATAEPAYLEKTNASSIHAALRLDPSVAAMDMNGAVRFGRRSPGSGATEYRRGARDGRRA